MHNPTRRNPALTLLLLSVAFVTSAFILPKPTLAEFVPGIPAGDPHIPAAPNNLKAYIVGNLVLLRWSFNTFSTQDVNAPQRTVVYRSEDGQNFKELISIPAVTGIFSDSTVTPGKNYYYRVAYRRIVQSVIPGAPGYDVESDNATLAQPVIELADEGKTYNFVPTKIALFGVLTVFILAVTVSVRVSITLTTPGEVTDLVT
jgi:hypothetical protein